jgi:hypothetical protein
MESKLRDKCTVDDFSGKQKVYSDLNTVSWQEDTTRIGNSTPQEVTGDKRVLTKRDFSCQVIFGRNDTDYIVKELTTPGSDTEMAMKASWARNVDDLIIAAASGTVYGGAEPYTTAITLGSDRKIVVNYTAAAGGASGSNTGLTPEKLIALAKAFELGDVVMGENSISGVEPMKVYLAISPRQKENLWTFVATAPNSPYAAMMSDFLSGKSTKLFGFETLVSNRLYINTGTDVRTCPAWAPLGIKVVPDGYQVMVDRLAEKKHAIQLSAYTQFGTMRRFEKMVGEIYCDESP